MIAFASVGDIVGHAEQVVTIAEPATVERLLDELQHAEPKLGPRRASLVVAINGEQARGESPLREGDLVALLPPYSGG